MNSKKPTVKPGQGATKTNIQQQIRNAGTNRAQGGADHLHRGDRRDMVSTKSK